jgi:SAM-dependent methyltransferase
MLRLLKNIFSDSTYITKHRLSNCIESFLTEIDLNGLICLDVGCGNRPYEYLFEGSKYIGIDVEVSGRENYLKQPDLFYDGINIPFENEKFDLVFCTQVLEHVNDPFSLIREMYRVLKPNGKLIISLPFSWQEHEEPYDFFRFSSFGISHLLNMSGFKIEKLKKDSSAIDTLTTLFIVYWGNNLVPKFYGFSKLFTLVCFPIQLFSLFLTKIFPDKGQLYLNLVVSANKKN